MKILILNGPNLNMLGTREPDIYGQQTYECLMQQLKEFAKTCHAELEIVQSNSEGELIDQLHRTKATGVVLNAGAYTHYSYALHDAIKCITAPVIEVHLSNVHAREDFRRQSVIASACIGSICGFGIDSYKLAIQYLAQK